MEKDVIKQIQEEIKTQRKIRGFWDGYCNLQKVVSGDIWESPTRYVYELLQNAEDEKATEFRIYVSRKRAKIIHNGETFSPEDVRNLCYATSKKDPSKSIGYLGVGFRSVFPATDKPEIYSGDYTFRFNREQCMEEFREPNLYYFYPFWIEEPTEKVDPKKTTFILPFREKERKERFEDTIEQIEKLGIQSLLFLRHIKSIRIQNEEENKEKVCYRTILEEFKPLPANEDIKVGKLQLVEGSIATRFLIFRGRFQVPNKVRNDEETSRAKRSNIKDREVSIAFQLDEQDNLKPTKGYLCSFFPLMERKNNFSVHADFIVQAGRIALRDTIWNRWLMEKAKEVALASYAYFQNNPSVEKWAEQFPSVFERREEVGEIYEDIFEKTLQEKTKNPMVKDMEGNRIPLDKAIKITEETDELVKRGFVKSSDLTPVFEKEVHLIRKDYPTGGRSVRELKMDDLNNEKFIEKKIREGKGMDFLRVFYPLYKKAMENRYSHYARDQQSQLIKSELGKLLVLDRGKNIRKQEEVWGEPDLKVFEELKGKGFNLDSILSQFNLVEQTLWKQCKDYLPAIKEISDKKIVEEGVLPKLKVTSALPSKKDVIHWAFLLKSYNIFPEEEIWVIDTESKVKSSKEVFLADQYDPPYKWQEFEFPEMNFLSEEYLELDKDPKGWKDFFKSTSLKGYWEEDYRNYIKENIFSLVKEEDAKKSSKNQLIQYTRAIKEYSLDFEESIYVVTKDNEILLSNSTYFPSQYSPKENWENQNIIPLKFLTPDYIGKEEDAIRWKEFFKKAGVREEGGSSEMINDFGRALTRKKFEKDNYHVNPYGGPCDLQAKKEDATIYIEVKTTTRGEVSETRLSTSQTKFAHEKKGFYYLVNIINVPNAPLFYLLKNPVNCKGATLETVIPKSSIDGYSEKIDVSSLIRE